MDNGLGFFTIPASIYRAARNAVSPAGNYSFFSAANFASTMTTTTAAALAAAVGSSGATGAAAGVKSSAGIDLSNNVGRRVIILSGLFQQSMLCCFRVCGEAGCSQVRVTKLAVPGADPTSAQPGRLNGCFPADAPIRRLNAATGALETVQISQLNFGDQASRRSFAGTPL